MKMVKINMFAMANLRSDKTGLPVTIWVEEKDPNSKGKHWARIKVAKEKGKGSIKDSVTVTIEDDPPKVIGSGLKKIYYNKVVTWITMNKEVLLEHWNNKIDTGDLIERLKKLEE